MTEKRKSKSYFFLATKKENGSYVYVFQKILKKSLRYRLTKNIVEEGNNLYLLKMQLNIIYIHLPKLNGLNMKRTLIIASLLMIFMKD